MKFITILMGVGAAVFLGFGCGSYFTRNTLENSTIPSVVTKQVIQKQIEEVERGMIWNGYPYAILRDNVSGMRIFVYHVGGVAVLPSEEEIQKDKLPCDQ